MNILLINHYAGSIKHGMEYRPFYLAREWARAGHTVTIVASSFSHVRTHAPQVSADLDVEEIEGVRYVWLLTPPYSGNGVKRAINIFAFVFKILRFWRYFVEVCQPDYVIASSTHPLDNIPARLIARKANAKLVYEVHDLWPLSLIEVGGMSPRHPFIMLLQWAENFAYRHADYTVSLLPNAYNHMEAHGLTRDRFVYIPNGIDVTEWAEDQASAVDTAAAHLELLAGLKAENWFLIGYAGAHGPANALDVIPKAAQLLVDNKVVFVLVGHGSEKERLQRLVDEMGLTNVILLPAVAKSAIPTVLSYFDALYIGLKREPLFRFGVSPNKLMDYMMAAKPVIYAIEAGNDPVAESRCGVSITPEDPAQLAEAAVHLKNLTEAERASMGANGRQYVLENHDYKLLSNRFLEAING
jgi:glycosyltransferase involved in cell wall biosynthesis